VDVASRNVGQGVKQHGRYGCGADAEFGAAPKAGGGLVLAVVYVTTLFFIWALVTNLLDPLLKTMKTVFTLTPVEANLTGFAFFIAYGVMSMPSAAFLSKSATPSR
jgi:FHS family L-fucose permease-like MFS transporter